MDRVRYGYAAAARIMNYYEYNVRICLALLYPPQALMLSLSCLMKSVGSPVIGLIPRSSFT